MIEKFFTNVAADQTCEENLRGHIEAAYAVTLKQYHSWIIQKSFSVSFHSNNPNTFDDFLFTMSEFSIFHSFYHSSSLAISDHLYRVAKSIAANWKRRYSS